MVQYSQKFASRHLSRRCLPRWAAALLILVGGWARGQTISTESTTRLETATEAGLNFLARNQEPDGSFSGGGPKIAMTGLSLLAFLACGQTPGDGRFGLSVRAAEDYLVKAVPADGYLGKLDGSRMYGQGIAVLALAEVSGVERDPQRSLALRQALERGLKVILAAQNVGKSDAFIGGWRYEPSSLDADLSLSGWNALALRACQNVGLGVPKEALQKAVQFVLKCYHREDGGFGYQPGAASSAAMTGVAVLNLYLLEATDRAELEAAGKFLRANRVNDDTRFTLYATYYATQAAYQAGGPTWEALWAAYSQALLARQMPDGGWPVSKTGEEPGRIYSSSLAILTLAVPYRLLPIYQR